MNVKVVLDGHSTNASEMQHNGMEGIKKVWSNGKLHSESRGMQVIQPTPTLIRD